MLVFVSPGVRAGVVTVFPQAIAVAGTVVVLAVVVFDLEPDRDRLAGQSILLEAQVGQEKAVDHIPRLEVEQHPGSLDYVELIDAMYVIELAMVFKALGAEVLEIVAGAIFPRLQPPRAGIAKAPLP